MLTDDERKKFAAYLEGEAASDLQMVAQLEKMTGQDAVVKHMKVRAAAKRMVAAELRSIETDSI